MNDKVPVLLDTSIWIDYFRNQSPEISTAVDSLLSEDQVRICGIVIAELIQGARAKKEIEALSEVADTLTALSETVGIWERAGRLAYDLRRKGRTIHIVDCYIAELVIENGCRLFTIDKHFKAIEKVRPLILF